MDGPPAYQSHKSATVYQSAHSTEPLPSYSSSPTRQFTPASGIDDGLQTTYRVGTKHTEPLVRPSDLQAHLRLLGAFHALKDDVRTQKGVLDLHLEPDQLWAIFLERAVHRFELWVSRMIDVLAREEDGAGQMRGTGRLEPDWVPPLDVIMVWHTYMLNPLDYFEDCLRMHPGLLRLGSFPLFQLASLIDGDTLLPHPPLETQRAAWVGFTGESFDSPLTTALGELITLHCPRCTTHISVPWVGRDEDGYAQRVFTATCSRCSMGFTRETIAVRKFYDDMEKAIVDSENHVLAKTLVDYATGKPEPQARATLTSILLGFKKNPTPQTPEELGRIHGWTFESVEKICRAGYMDIRDKPYLDPPRPVNIVLSAYKVPGPFNIDLASAVMRQTSFVNKMVTLGWTEDDRFEDNKDTLARCINRYHAFLDLMISTPGKFVVPTLDIDLAWHTHQLQCDSYRKLYDLMGIIPDHDDKVTQGALATAYDATADAWKDRFGVPYSVCGCLPPSATKPTGSTGGMGSIFSKKGKSKAPAEKSINNSRQDLLSTRDMHAEETHPSEHNSVTIILPPKQNPAQPPLDVKLQSAALAQQRDKDMDKRSKEVVKLVEKGKTDAWTELQCRRLHGDGRGHPHAFLCPVQYGAKDPFGTFGSGDCAVYSGGALGGPLGAGACAKGNGHNGQCGALFDQPRGGIQQAIDTGIIMSGRRLFMDDVAREMIGFDRLDGRRPKDVTKGSTELGTGIYIKGL